MVLNSICVQNFHYLMVLGKNVINLGIDMSSSVHIDNKKKYILVLGIGPIQISDDTTLTPEA